ncbi:MAG TPA: NUDIX domain-containing protein [Thermodesulfobacteriaceae bacterium]|nr:NUDIX domain-containing protein [Thermodesulfobacteriaceae bacterium]
MTNPSDELVTIVDEDNNEICRVARRVMRNGNLTHRASYVIVYNSRGELFVMKRTSGKDIYPGCYEIAAGGVVLAGETYEESARRELFEELGIVSRCIETLFDFFFSEEGNSVWGRVFKCVHDGPMIFQEEEVAGGEFLRPEAAMALSRKKNFTPDSVMLLRRLLGQNGITDRIRPGG